MSARKTWIPVILNTQVHTAHAVFNPDYGVRHLILKLVDEMQQIPGVIPPACCCNVSPPDGSLLESRCTIISQDGLIPDTTSTLIEHVGNPNSPDSPTLSLKVFI